MNWSQRRVRASARVHTYTKTPTGGPRGGPRMVGGHRRGTEAKGEGCFGLELCSCSCEELRLTFSSLSLSHSLSRPLPPPRLVPLNKLVRFNDSYFFLVTRLPSFAPNAPLEKVAVNLVGSPRFLRSLSLSFSPSLSPCCRVFGHEGSP